jgi:hypothetical protein
MSNTARLNNPKFLIGRWQFNNNLDDISGYSRNASLTAGTETYEEGDFANTVNVLDGSTYHSVSDNITFNNVITVSVWIKTTTNNATKDDYIFAKYDTGENNRVFGINHANSTNKAAFVTSEDGQAKAGNLVLSNNAINDGVWHHIVGVHDGDKNYIYVDGDYNNEVDATNGLYDTNQATVFGTLLSSNSPMAGTYFIGSIFDARIYNVVLTGDEIKALFKQGRRVLK